MRNIARRMVAQWGFTVGDVDIGLVGWEAPEAGRFSPRTLSDETEIEIDAEVRKLCDNAYDVCKDALGAHRALMDMVVDELLEKETIDSKRLLALLEKYDPELCKNLGKRPEPEMDPLATEPIDRATTAGAIAS